MRPALIHVATTVLGALLLTGCPNSGPSIDAGPPPVDAAVLFPSDYRTSFVPVLPCSDSRSNHPNYVMAYANAAGAPPYDGGAFPFAPGSVIVKEEYADSTCTQLTGYSVMRKEPGLDATHLDWHWQHVTAARLVNEDGIVARCYQCHQSGCVGTDNVCSTGR